MFLRYQGYSKRFGFDVIYSALQKSLRRGDEKLAIEMGYEFFEYPNALKKRLIQNCCEDCPDLNLINDISNTPQDIRLLMAYIPVICNHVKTHDGCFGMRIACEKEPLKDKPNLGENHDDLLTLLCKCFYYITQNDEISFISFFQQLYPKIDLIKIYKFIGEHKTFLYMLCVWETVDYIHEKYEVKPFNFESNKKFNKSLKLPEYVYDKHVRSGPKSHKTYSYFVDNLVLYPRKEETEIEKEGRKLLIETDRGITEIFASLNISTKEKARKDNEYPNLERIDHKAKIIHVKDDSFYFCSLNDGKKYDKVLRGPFENEEAADMQILSDLIKQKLISNGPSYSSKKISFKNQIFILSTNVIPIDKSKIIDEKSDSNDENVAIYTGNKFTYSHEVVSSLSSNEILELLKILAFRKIIGTNNTCPRNIIHCFKHIYTINDPVLLQTTPFMFSSHLDKFEMNYEKIVSNNFKKISCFLHGWQTTIRNAPDISDNVKAFMFTQITSLFILDNWKF